MRCVVLPTTFELSDHPIRGFWPIVVGGEFVWISRQRPVGVLFLPVVDRGERTAESELVYVAYQVSHRSSGSLLREGHWNAQS